MSVFLDTDPTLESICAIKQNSCDQIRDQEKKVRNKNSPIKKFNQDYDAYKNTGASLYLCSLSLSSTIHLRVECGQRPFFVIFIFSCKISRYLRIL